MLDNTIRGGQLFLHHIRMFKQVAGYAAIIAFFLGLSISAIFNYGKLDTIEWTPALTYWRGRVIDKTDDIVPNLGKVQTQMTINIAQGFGEHRDVPIKHFIEMGYYVTHGMRLLNLILTFLLHAALLATGIFIVLFWGWNRFGKHAKATKFLKGNKIHTAREVETYLNNKGTASDLKIDEMPLVKDSEIKHILITGSTGSGKSNCLHILLPQIRARRNPAIVIDTEGAMIERYYRPGKDIIINPFDARSHEWDFWDEIIDERLTEKVANSLFPEGPADAYTGDKRWNSWGRMLFLGAVQYLKAENTKTVKALFELLHKAPLEALTDSVRDTDISGLFDSASDQNSAPHNIRMNTMEATKWLKYFVAPKTKKFSFRKWFDGLDETCDDRWIFIGCRSGDSDFLLPFISSLTDIAMSSLISLKADSNRRIWFVTDELGKLKYVPTLEHNITLLRKYGGCVLAATQSFKQLFLYYGRNSGSIMLSQFNTNLIFKMIDGDDAAVIAKRAGDIEILQQQKNTSYGASEIRDGISYTEQRKNRPLIEARDVANLESGEAFVLLPDTDVAIAKIKTKVAPVPVSTQPDFVQDDNPVPVESMKNQEQAATVCTNETDDRQLTQKKKERPRPEEIF